MQEPINIGVIGCGYWGPNHIRNFISIPASTVKYACDLDESRLIHLKKIYPTIETTINFEKIINDPEVQAIVIATPVHLHYEIAKMSLLAGKHTLIEKPMASSVSQCTELLNLAGKLGLTLTVGHTFIYSAPVRKIKEIIASGELGELLYISSKRLNLGLFQKDINVAWDLAPHDISIICHILENRPISVNCQGKAHIFPGIEDVTVMSLDFESGGFATIHNSWLDPNKIRRMTFVGTKKMLLYDDSQPLEKIKIYDKSVETPPYYDTFAEFHYSYHYGDTYSPHLNQIEPLKEQSLHFLDCIKNGSRCLSGGLEGLQVVRILEAASESLKNGGNKVLIDWKV